LSLQASLKEIAGERGMTLAEELSPNLGDGKGQAAAA